MTYVGFNVFVGNDTTIIIKTEDATERIPRGAVLE